MPPRLLVNDKEVRFIDFELNYSISKIIPELKFRLPPNVTINQGDDVKLLLDDYKLYNYTANSIEERRALETETGALTEPVLRYKFDGNLNNSGTLNFTPTNGGTTGYGVGKYNQGYGSAGAATAPDITAPVGLLSLSNPVDQGNNQYQITATVTSNEAGTVTVVNDHDSQTWTETLTVNTGVDITTTLTATSSSITTVTYTATFSDSAGNTSTVTATKNLPAYVDLTAPTVTFSATNPAQNGVNRYDIAMTINSNESGTAYISNDHDSQTITRTITAGTPLVVTETLQVQSSQTNTKSVIFTCVVTDAASNTTTKMATITLPAYVTPPDTTDPVATLTVSNPTHLGSNIYRVVCTIHSNENGHVIITNSDDSQELTANLTANIQRTVNLDLTSTSASNTTVTITAVIFDNANNDVTRTANITLPAAIDFTPPTATITASDPTANGLNGYDVVITLQSNENGTVTVTNNFDNQSITRNLTANTSIQVTETFSVPSTQTNTRDVVLSGAFSDNNGNSVIRTATVTLPAYTQPPDTTAPTVSVTLYAPTDQGNNRWNFASYTTSNEDGNVIITNSHDNQEVTATLTANTQKFSNYVLTVHSSQTNSKSVTFTFVVSDAAGNTRTVTRTGTLPAYVPPPDTTAPTITTSGAALSTTGNAHTKTITVQSNENGSVTITNDFDSQSITRALTANTSVDIDVTLTVDSTNTSDTSVTYTITVSDSAGNEATNTITDTLPAYVAPADVTAPSVTLSATRSTISTNNYRYALVVNTNEAGTLSITNTHDSQNLTGNAVVGDNSQNLDLTSTVSSDTTITITVTVTDSSNNVGTATASVTLPAFQDVISPTVTISAATPVASGTNNVYNVTITLNSNEAGTISITNDHDSNEITGNIAANSDTEYTASLTSTDATVTTVTFSAIVTDASGNSNTAVTDSVSLPAFEDHVAPVGTVTLGPPTLNTSNTDTSFQDYRVNITVSTNEDCRFQLTNDYHGGNRDENITVASGYTTTMNFKVVDTQTTTTTVTISTTFTDDAGNANSYTNSFTLPAWNTPADTTPPTVSVSAATPVSQGNNVWRTAITINANEDATATITNNHDSQSLTANLTANTDSVTNLDLTSASTDTSDQTVTITVSTVDAGNNTTTTTASITLPAYIAPDTTAPTITATDTITDGSVTDTSDVQLNVTSNESGTYTITNDQNSDSLTGNLTNGTVNVSAGTWNRTSSDYDIIFTITGADSASNSTSITHTVTISAETTAPTVTFSAGVPTSQGNNVWRSALSLSSNEAGNATITNDHDSQSLTATLTAGSSQVINLDLTSTANTDQTITITSVVSDVAGNETTSTASITLPAFVDTTDPTATATAGTATSLGNNQYSIQVTINSNEAGTATMTNNTNSNERTGTLSANTDLILTETFTIPSTQTTQSTVTFSIVVADESSNEITITASATLPVYQDLTAPNPTVSLTAFGQDSGNLNRYTNQVRIDPDEAGRYEVTNSYAAGTYSGNLTVGTQAQINHTFIVPSTSTTSTTVTYTIKVWDSANNLTTITRTATLPAYTTPPDTTSPTVTLSAGTPTDAGTNLWSIILTINSNENGSTVITNNHDNQELTGNLTANTNTEVTLTLTSPSTLTADKTVTITAVTSDSSSNVTTSTVDITLPAYVPPPDTTAPIGYLQVDNFVQQTDVNVYRARVQFSSNEIGSMVLSTDYDSQTWERSIPQTNTLQSLNVDLTATASSTTTVVFTIVISDAAGNAQTITRSKTLPAYIAPADTTPPTFAWSVGTRTDNGDDTYTWQNSITSSEDGSYTITNNHDSQSLAGALVSQTQRNQNITLTAGSSETTVTLTCVVADGAGNETTKTRTITLPAATPTDTTAPTVDVFGVTLPLTEVSTNVYQIQVGIRSNEAGSVSITNTFNSDTWTGTLTANTLSYVTRNLTPTAHTNTTITLTGTISDEAGNETERQVSFILPALPDTTAPTTTMNVGTPTHDGNNVYSVDVGVSSNENGQVILTNDFNSNSHTETLTANTAATVTLQFTATASSQTVITITGTFSDSAGNETVRTRTTTLPAYQDLTGPIITLSLDPSSPSGFVEWNIPNVYAIAFVWSVSEISAVTWANNFNNWTHNYSNVAADTGYGFNAITQANYDAGRMFTVPDTQTAPVDVTFTMTATDDNNNTTTITETYELPAYIDLTVTGSATGPTTNNNEHTYTISVTSNYAGSLTISNNHDSQTTTFNISANTAATWDVTLTSDSSITRDTDVIFSCAVTDGASRTETATVRVTLPTHVAPTESVANLTEITKTTGTLAIEGITSSYSSAGTPVIYTIEAGYVYSYPHDTSLTTIRRDGGNTRTQYFTTFFGNDAYGLTIRASDQHIFFIGRGNGDIHRYSTRSNASNGSVSKPSSITSISGLTEINSSKYAFASDDVSDTNIYDMTYNHHANVASASFTSVRTLGDHGEYVDCIVSLPNNKLGVGGNGKFWVYDYDETNGRISNKRTLFTVTGNIRATMITTDNKLYFTTDATGNPLYRYDYTEIGSTPPSSSQTVTLNNQRTITRASSVQANSICLVGDTIVLYGGTQTVYRTTYNATDGTMTGSSSAVLLPSGWGSTGCCRVGDDLLFVGSTTGRVRKLDLRVSDGQLSNGVTVQSPESQTFASIFYHDGFLYYTVMPTTNHNIYRVPYTIDTNTFGNSASIETLVDHGVNPRGIAYLGNDTMLVCDNDSKVNLYDLDATAGTLSNKRELFTLTGRIIGATTNGTKVLVSTNSQARWYDFDIQVG